MKTLTIKEVKSLFARDSETRKANKSANAVVLNACALVNDSDKITVEFGNSGAIPNRGSTIECIVNLWWHGQKNAKAKENKVLKSTNQWTCDLTDNGKRYEIKASTSKGYAHYNPAQDLTNLIFVNQYGIFLTSGRNIILDKCGKHIKDIKINKETKQLVAF